MNYTHKKTNKSTNMKATVLPPGSLGSYLRRPTPIASGDGRERSYSGKAWSCLCAPAWIAELQRCRMEKKRCCDAATDHRGL